MGLTFPEAPLSSRPDREVSISWSRLRDWTECTERSHLVARGFRSRVIDVRGYFHGNVVDLCMRTWLDQARPQPGQMAAMVGEVFDSAAAAVGEKGEGTLRWRHPKDREETRAWCYELVTRLEPILLRLAIPYDYQPALRFKVPVTVPYLDGTPQRIWLNGEIDLLCREEKASDEGTVEVIRHGYHVWDLKGTADDSYWRKVTGQIVFYNVAVRVMLGSWPVKSGLIQPMCRQREIELVVTEEARREMMVRIARMAESMWRGDHAPKVTTAGCSWCPVQHACPRFAVRSHQAPVGV